LKGISSGDLVINAVRMRRVTKRFETVTANENVDFELQEREIHALLGENGSGKTTLMNILYGLYRADEGEVYVRGRAVHIRSPRDAIEHGIGMVHEHFSLVDVMTATENVVLGLKSPSPPLLRIQDAQAKIVELSKKYGLQVDPNAVIRDISVGERQRVEILKALYQNCGILILDEPTSMLTPHESVALFKILRSMVQQGLSIVFITHKLPEALAVSDRITVLRKGKVVLTVEAKSAREKELVRAMVGREIPETLHKGPSEARDVVARLEGICSTGDEGTEVVKNVSFDVRAGEILGIAGVAGNGQKGLIDCLMGLRRVAKGTFSVCGRDCTNKPTKYVCESGVGWIPEDWYRGVVFELSVAENLILKSHSSTEFSSRWALRSDKIQSYAQKLVSEFQIDTPTVFLTAGKLSSGNIQRVILARELSLKPRFLIADNPTKALDINATEFTQKKLIEQREQGAGVLLVSMDLDEIMALSDRIAVMYRGELIGIMDRSQAETEKIGLMMAGAKT